MGTRPPPAEPERLRVLFVCLADFTAPSENQVLELSRGLLRSGHAVAVSCGGDPATLPTELDGPLPAVWRHGLMGPRLSHSAQSQARAFAPTLVHAFSPRSPALTVARRYARVCGAPVLVHFEDDEWGLAGSRPGEGALRRLGRPARRLAGHAHPPLWPFVTASGLRWVRQWAAGLDGLTPTICEEVSRRLGRSCAVVPPPVTPAPAGRPAGAPPPIGVGERSAIVLYTGALFGAHRADFEIALDAMVALRAQGRAVTLVHTGRSAPRFDLREVARERGLDDGGAVFLGYRPWSEVEALMKAADVLVQPGAPSEFNRLRLPAKLPVYLHSGTPTVTFAVGAGELLEDRREVLKTHTGEPRELADRIAELLDDAELRSTLARGGPDAARRLFSTENAAARLAEHYRTTLAGARGAAT